jgi:hypothetical protein
MNLELYMDFVSSFESFLSLFWMKMENKVFSLSYKLKSNMDIYKSWNFTRKMLSIELTISQILSGTWSIICNGP